MHTFAELRTNPGQQKYGIEKNLQKTMAWTGHVGDDMPRMRPILRCSGKKVDAS